MIVYAILGYWAVGRTLLRDKMMIGSLQGMFLTKFVLGFLLGVILIPWAVISLVFDIVKR